ncbi:MAG: ribosome small subunit-dependent GTPase A [Acidimicrobiales bacterium]
MPSHPLHSVGWSDRVDALLSPLLGDGRVAARVVGVERGWATVATPTGDRSIPVPGMAVGDWVALDGDTVPAAIPRWSTLGRLGPDGARQVLAANLDLVLIAAPADRLSSNRVERELVIAWDSGAQPVVVVTKLDVAEPHAVDDLASRLGPAELIATSSVAGEGLDALRARLVHPITAALLGPSGSGKSTLINALLGEERLAVGAVRDEDNRGRHTTTSRQLVPIPSGGSLIDMPGLRSLGTDAAHDAVAATFPEIDELAVQCRFADCAHDVEPGCAILAAASGGELDPARLASYHKLAREAALERRRTDPLAQQESTKIAKVRTKEQRRVYRERDR